MSPPACVLAGYKSAISRRDAPEVCPDVIPLMTEGTGKAGCPKHPQPVCIGSKHTVVTTVAPEITRLSPRNGFNGFLRALVSGKSARMCERAVLTNRPSLDLSPFVLKGP